MYYSQFISIVNISCIVMIVALAVILLVATKFKGANGYAAAIIVLPNVPVYLYNVGRMLGWYDFAFYLFPLSFSVNTILMPLLWLFTQKNFSADFRFKWVHFLHFIPAILCLVLAMVIPSQERYSIIRYESSGADAWIGHINAMVITIQLIVYFSVIFHYIYIKKKAINNTLSDSEWVTKEWIPKFMFLFAILFVVVMFCYAIWPRTDAWLIQILNLIAMFYLVYFSIKNPYLIAPAKEEKENEQIIKNAVPSLSESQMRQICQTATDYLSSTRAYLREDLSLSALAKELNIPSRNLSKSINTCLGLNFFSFINRMRIEEAKHLLFRLDTSDYSIDSIYSECGFHSRSTFFLVFKKIEGKTPAAWLSEQGSK